MRHERVKLQSIWTTAVLEVIALADHRTLLAGTRAVQNLAAIALSCVLDGHEGVRTSWLSLTELSATIDSHGVGSESLVSQSSLVVGSFLRAVLISVIAHLLHDDRNG